MDLPPTLAERTTLRVGGRPNAWLTPNSEVDVVAAVLACDAVATPVLLLGGGSNLLVSDDGFRGTVIELSHLGADARLDGDRVVLNLAAGETWDDVVSRAVARGWTGVEALSGIPGRVGATPVQNVGAYGQDVAQVITSVRALDRRTGDVVDLSRDDCAFGYRTSRFKREPDRWVVLSVVLDLGTDGLGVVRYSELATALGVEVGARVPVAAIRGAVLALRARKGMVLDPADHDTWSAGSFFTNPIVDATTSDRIATPCPRYPADDGIKLSAAWLIENAGIARGFSIAPGARAAISGKHSLALTNRGDASAQDVIDLARVVRERVAAVHGIDLAAEPVLVGVRL